MPRCRFPTAKVGDDLVLQYELTDADIESATLTVRDGADDGEIVLSAAAASLPTARIAQYVWTPAAAGNYLVEWHVQHSGGVDLYTPTVEQVVEDRIAA